MKINGIRLASDLAKMLKKYNITEVSLPNVILLVSNI